MSTNDLNVLDNKRETALKDLSLNKKQYLLAGVDQSIGQLNKEQVESLTKILISLKSEYDVLTRESTNKKHETEKIGKQITMLEKMDNKYKGRIMEMEEESQTIDIDMEKKKRGIEEESYAKKSFMHIINRMKSDLHTVRLEINNKEHESQKLDKEYEKEKISEAEIKVRLNQIHSNITKSKQKNAFEKNENDLILKYYKTIILQKESFINSADERKLKQERIALDAKNDNQDKQEVEKRRTLNLLKLYNKFIRKKIEKELKDNEKIEHTFQTLNSITVIITYILGDP